MAQQKIMATSAPKKEMVGKSEIRLITVNTVRQADVDQVTFVPTGTYRPEDFPALERVKREWAKEVGGFRPRIVARFSESQRSELTEGACPGALVAIIRGIG